MPSSSDNTPLAYSYIRFSTREQASGDSLRRQTEATRAWCERNGVRLDSSTTLRDLGKSAYTGQHRKNPDRHALAGFLKLVEAGKIPKGSYLIIENLDRLSREEERPALRLWMDLLDAGVNIVQLTPETIFRHEKSDMFDIMRAVMELSRGHGESAVKSVRISAAWSQKKKACRDGGIFSRRLPSWVEERDGRLRLVPEKAAIVKRIFKLTAAGYGNFSIVKLFASEGVPPFGTREIYKDDDGRDRERAKKGQPLGSGQWLRSYINAILKDRRAMGEFQPKGKNGVPDGDPIPGYFPAVVTEEQWNAAREGANQRRRRPGRIGKHVNVFGGMVRNARDGDTYFVASRRGARRVLINTASFDGRVKCWSFPFATFDAAMLSVLREVDPREVVGGKGDGPDEVMVLSGEQAAVESKIAEFEAELLNGDVPSLARTLRQLEERNRDLGKRLAEARRHAAHPLSEAWGEAHSLLAALDAAPDQYDARLRLRAALRRVVESIWLLAIPRGMDRLAAVQVWFAGDGCRTYGILHRPRRFNGKAGTEGEWWVKSLEAAGIAGAFDLRRPEDAAKLEAALARVKLDG